MKYDVCLYADDKEAIKVRKLICDKCGKEVDTQFMDKFDIRPSSMVRIFGDKYSKIMTENQDLEYELCENCTNELVEFLKG